MDVANNDRDLALFDPGKTTFAPVGNEASSPPRPADMDKHAAHAAENPWTAMEDEMLRSLVDKYPNNWKLIAEAFTSNRVAITQRRTPWDCQQRWEVIRAPRRSHSVAEEAKPEPPPTPSTPASSMTTRGVKRQAAANLSTAAPADGAESRKRRRHATMHDAIMKATKKRIQLQKTQGVFMTRNLSFCAAIDCPIL